MQALDPTLPHMFAALLAIVFLGGAWQKLRDPDGFAMAVEQYRLLPSSWVTPAAWGLLAAEAAAGLLLLPLATRTAGAAVDGRRTRSRTSRANTGSLVYCAIPRPRVNGR